MAFRGGELVNKKGANAFCDRTGFVCKRSDLRKQMRWAGTELIWTRSWVHKDFLDIPNPAMKTIILPPDPVPIEEPRHGVGLDSPVPAQDAGSLEERLAALDNIKSTTNGLIF